MIDAFQKDRIKGCLFGGAIGDALGYPVEFMSQKGILSQFGAAGVQNYILNPKSGKAVISDDTQMSLFTANGLLAGITDEAETGTHNPLRTYVAQAYQDWLRTQNLNYREGEKWLRDNKGKNHSWLSEVPELYHLRAPGNTCIAALERQKNHPMSGSFIRAALNNSKGCGGVMRVAPLGLIHYPNTAQKEMDLEGAEIAAVTHGHPLGYMPAAVLTHMIHDIVYGTGGTELKEIVREAIAAAEQLFVPEQYPEAGARLGELTDILYKAVKSAENSMTDMENISRLGGGWVGEEALAIAVYCALRYPNDFSAGITASVSHGGDSDSTGAITGNILGAYIGYDAIDPKWKKDLELSDVLCEMTEDLILCARNMESKAETDTDWQRKYVRMCWKEKKPEDEPENREPKIAETSAQTFRLAPEDAPDILSILAATGVYKNRAEAEFGVRYGAVRVNNSICTDTQIIFTEEELKEGILIRRSIRQPILVIR